MPQDFRYRRLGYVALNVSDVERSADFYRDFVGLTAGRTGVERRTSVPLQRTPPRRGAASVECCRAAARRLGDGVGERRREVRAHLQSLDIEAHPVGAAECEALGVRDAFRITEPNDGHDVRIFPFASQRRRRRSCRRVAKIARLGHLVLFATDHKAASEKFFLEQLNFRASDRIEGARYVHALLPEPAASFVRRSATPAKIGSTT